MSPRLGHAWEFRTKLRSRAFGWRGTALATKRLKEAVAEIKKVAKTDPATAAEGGVVLYERLWPALQGIDGSSGALGSAVRWTIGETLPILEAAALGNEVRDGLLKRVWLAAEKDGVDYLSPAIDHWGALWGTAERASLEADRVLPAVRAVWRDRKKGGGSGYFFGTAACLSCLLAAGRFDELFALLEEAPFAWWPDRRFGFEALIRQGRVDDAIAYALAGKGRNDGPQVARACETALISAGRSEEAYTRFAMEAGHTATSYLGTFRALAKVYPAVPPGRILGDLIQSTQGQEGKWFAAAKELGMFDLAVDLVSRAPTDPRTLTRAAVEFETRDPTFAETCAMAALRWIGEGYGYEVTSVDVLAAQAAALRAARHREREDSVRTEIADLVARATVNARLLAKVLGLPVPETARRPGAARRKSLKK